ncbi:MAG: T9SS type A sorting domain-containing protein [Chitinophagaceae bacterium]
MKNVLTILALIIFIHSTNAQQLAFPSAEGAGRFTSGGRGTSTALTSVFYVTSLADDGSVGTLRYAVNQTAAYRTIVFSVSGTIHLASNLSIRANTTIAGQTAPAGGICIADRSVTLGGNNIIIRYIRFRLGDKNQLKTTPVGCGVPVAPFTAACMPLNGSGGDDAFGGTGRKNILIDHCTMSWSNDEVCSIYEGDSTTVQWCMLSEPLNFSYHFETGDTDFERHGYGGIWGGRRSTFHHNLLAHCQGRACRFDGSRNLDGGATPGAENCEFVNNVIYNWGAYNVNGGEGGNYNIINNYYKYGPSTATSVRSQIVNPYKTAPLPYGKFFVSGNYVDGNTNITNRNWLGAKMDGGSLADTTQSKVTVPFAISNINLQSATDAYNDVLKNVGVTIPSRDTLDTRIVKNVINRTGKIIDVQGNYPHGTAYANTVNAWPTLLSGNAPKDNDVDGMPTWWEKREGLNPASNTDRATITANGYTALEKYLNEIPAWNAHANFVSLKATKINSTLAKFNFVTDWVKDGFTYALFSSTDSLGIYTKVNSISSNIDSINFTVDDTNLPATTTFYKIGSYKIGVTPDTLYSNIVKIEGIVTPVKMAYYEAKLQQQNNGNTVIENKWFTVTEVNTAYFEVQRSFDGADFKTIIKITAKGSGEYLFNDIIPNNNLPQVIFYRIISVDNDGAKQFSDIKQIKLNPTQTKKVSVYPNPAKNSFVVSHNAAKKNTIIQLVNESARVCLSINVKEGTNSTNIIADKLAKGNYTVVLKDDTGKTSTSIIIL